jgi:hypothetical protein
MNTIHRFGDHLMRAHLLAVQHDCWFEQPGWVLADEHDLEAEGRITISDPTRLGTHPSQ